MKRQLSLFIVLVVLCVSVNTELEVRVPKISTFLNKLTNTTFDLIRGGVNIYARTVERVISTFGKIEDRLRGIIEDIRKYIVSGIPELNIPVLDPLHIDKIEFKISQEIGRINGRADNVTVKHISQFTVDKVTFNDLGKLRFRLDLNVTFPHLLGSGKYNVNGMFADAFQIFGEGSFWIHLTDLKVQTITVLKYEQGRIRVADITIDLKLHKLENHFDNLMNDKENGELINKAISALAPEALEILWPELKKPVQRHVQQYINNLLDNATVANLARRLFNLI